MVLYYQNRKHGQLDTLEGDIKMIALIMIALISLVVISNLISNRQADTLTSILRHESISRGYSSHGIVYKHYNRFNVCAVIVR